MANTYLIQGEDLIAFGKELFKKAGMSEADADFHANALVQTNYW